MGLFSKIMDKLGFGKAQAATPPPPRPAAAPTSPAPVPSAAPAPKAVPVVDVLAQLEDKAAKATQKLNWKTSIVDLQKLLDLDSSFAARKEMAVELGIPADLLKDSAQMNMWLHKTVLKKLAEHGGNIPAELLD